MVHLTSLVAADNFDFSPVLFADISGHRSKFKNRFDDDTSIIMIYQLLRWWCVPTSPWCQRERFGDKWDDRLMETRGRRKTKVARRSRFYGQRTGGGFTSQKNCKARAFLGRETKKDDRGTDEATIDPSEPQPERQIGGWKGEKKGKKEGSQREEKAAEEGRSCRSTEGRVGGGDMECAGDVVERVVEEEGEERGEICE